MATGGGFDVRTATGAGTLAARAAVLCFCALCAVMAAGLFAMSAAPDGLQAAEIVATALIAVTTAWLAWGAGQSFLGLAPRRVDAPPRLAARDHARTVMLLPICNEDPDAAMARLAAMDASMRAAGLGVDIAVLSDTRDPAAREREEAAFARLHREIGGQGRLFYRNRPDNHGRKAGNIEDFLRRHGAGWELALILDADSLMEGKAIARMIARMEDEPDLGLLQTLPVVVGAGSLFGRAMQFAARFHSPIFARGLARMQGRTGPFWGHNAIVRIRAMAECCALPELSGRPPFGGTILSHDYVEAALLARGGWRVTLDETIRGSFEEGPETILSHVRRDRRWCQGNLQYLRLLGAPGLRPWSRFVFLQGILSYLVSILWAGFLAASVLAAATTPAPDYFPEPGQLFPAFPIDRTVEFVALCVGVGVLLILPKLAILIEAIATGRAHGFGGGARAAASVSTELLLSSVLAPVLLMYQTRAVLEVLSGRDGGWPANLRGEGAMSLVDGWRAGGWISLWGTGTLAAVAWAAPVLTWWLAPVCVPMMVAPLLISWTSRPRVGALFLVPEEQAVPEVVAAYRARLATQASAGDPGAAPGKREARAAHAA